MATENIGRVVQIIGPVLDVEFETEHLPEIYNALTIRGTAPDGGEIDVVCRHRDTLVFVEVKTRTGEDFGRPIEAIDRDKRKRISRGALAWLRLLNDPDILFRFDVVEVIIAEGAEPRLELIQNAFALSEPYIY